MAVSQSVLSTVQWVVFGVGELWWWCVMARCGVCVKMH